MSNFKMVYENKVYNCVNLSPYWNEDRVENLEVFYIDEDNRLSFIRDSADKFQFISK